MQNDKQFLRQELQKIANEHQTKVYRYLLKNGNTFSTIQPMTKSETIGGSKVDKLLEIFKPEKKTN